MRTLYYFIHLTGRDPGNTGIQRVVRNLGRSLQELGRCDRILPVRWCHLTNSIVHAEEEFITVIALHGGPRFPSSEFSGTPIPPARSEEDWLLIPEVPHLGSHDSRYPSVQIGPVIGCAKRRGYRVAVVFHDILPLFEEAVINEGLLNQYRFMVYAQALANADLVLPNSIYSKESLNDWLSANGVSANHLPRAIELPLPEEMRGVPRRLPEYRKRGARESIYNFVALGTVCTRKNQLAAIEAFDRVRRKFPKVKMHLHVVGHIHPEVEAGVRQAKSLMEGHLSISGFLSDDAVRDLVMNARASVFVSLAEGYGLPVAESLWMGTPCLCSNNGAVGEIAAGGGCVAVDPSSIESICAGFERLIFDDAKYKILLEEIAARPLRSWADYANLLLDHLYSKSIDYDAEPADAAADSIRISADKFTCHRAYARNGVDTLRYGNNILYVRSVHGRVDEPHLFHGPYITLEPGNYSLFIDGKLDGSMNIELLKDQGNKFYEFQADDFNRPFQVHLPEKIKNFEMRGVLTKNTERLKLSCVVMTREGGALRNSIGVGQSEHSRVSRSTV